MSAACFECGLEAKFDHHVVPRSRGGTQTVPLCAECHGYVHNRQFTDVRYLTSRALQAKKARGQRLGQPVKLPDSVRQRIVSDRARGRTLQAIADDLTADGIQTARGGRWWPSTVRHVVNSVALDEQAAAIRNYAEVPVE